MKISFRGNPHQLLHEMRQIVDRHEQGKQPFSHQSDDVIASAFRSLSFYKTEELQAELVRRDATIPGRPDVTFGLVTKAEIGDAVIAAGFPQTEAFAGPMQDALENFARSRGVL